ncbi:hypothetical protein RRF57_012455 [Xylaria bambusicola]|uniref:DUF2470 domain-containing protein n=1 Tax=Xylaria bambusicola TaxID=326684 RepID=A0AAN7ZEP8_9PEZI
MAASDPRARIMSHMNKEHDADLSRYLQAFNGLPASAASAAKLTDLTFDTLTIQSRSGVHSVRITPPMKSFADARVRLVDMAERAQAKLGLGDVRIDRFEGPQGAGLASFIGVSVYFVSAAALALGFLRPGTAAWAALDGFFPYKGAEGFVWLVRMIFVPVFAIHVTEAWWMAQSRLKKFNVETGSALWFSWVAETFLEGVPAFQRFDGMVREEKRKKDAAKH